MSDFFRGRHIRKTRKDHRCYECGKIISKGDSCQKSCTVLDGQQFLHGYFCYNCVPDKRPKVDSAS